MIAVIAKLPVKEGSEAAFEAAMLEMAAEVRAKEPGCQQYLLCKGDDGYVMLELYDDAAALEAHGASEHFKAGGAKLGPHLAGRPDIQRLEVIG